MHKTRFFVIIFVFLTFVSLGNARSAYDILQDGMSIISSNWLQTRTADEKSARAVKNIIDLTSNPNATKKATKEQFTITAKAIISSTLYDIRHDLIKKSHVFSIPVIKTNNRALVNHHAIVASLVFMTRAASAEINNRMNMPLIGPQYPFEQTNFRATIKSKALGMLGHTYQGYKPEIQKAMNTDWFFNAFLGWFDEIDQNYDIKDDDDFRAEVQAIESKKKGVVETIKNLNKKDYRLYKNEFGQSVAIRKSGGNPNKENVCYKISKEITPGSVARNYVSGGALVEQYTAFVDRPEVRHLLIKAKEQNFTTPKAMYDFANEFVKEQDIMKKNNHDYYEKNKKNGFNYSQRQDGTYHYSEQLEISNCFKTASDYADFLKNQKFNDGITLQFFHHPILAVWNTEFYTNMIERYKRDWQKQDNPMTIEEERGFKGYVNALKPTIGKISALLKKGIKAIENASPDLAREIKQYYTMNHALGIKDAHQSNAMITSKNGQMRFVLIDTELADFTENAEYTQLCQALAFFNVAKEAVSLQVDMNTCLSQNYIKKNGSSTVGQQGITNIINRFNKFNSTFKPFNVGAYNTSERFLATYYSGNAISDTVSAYPSNIIYYYLYNLQKHGTSPFY